MSEADRPFVVLTVLVNSAARAAAVTRSHADALERVRAATAGLSVAGIELAELVLPAKTFSALRKAVDASAATVGLYDLFPVSSAVDGDHRRVAGRFLAAEAIWALDEQGAFGPEAVPFHFDVPKDWPKDPKALHERLLSAGVLELSPAAVESFVRVKQAWEASAPPAPQRASAAPEAALETATA